MRANRESGSKLMKTFLANRYRIALLAIVIFGAVLSTIFFYGPSPINSPDNFWYPEMAYNAYIKPTIAPSGGVLIDQRYIIIYGIAFFYALLGPSAFSAAMFGIVTFVLTILVMYKLGGVLYNQKAGLLAAFLYSFSPQAVIFSSNVGDNGTVAFFASLCVLCIALAVKGSAHRRFYYATSGFVGMIGFLVSPETLIIFSFVGIVLLIQFVKTVREDKAKDFFLDFAFLTCGIAIATLAIMSLSYAFHGDPFYLLSSSGNYFANLQGAGNLFSGFEDYISWLFPYGETGKILALNSSNLSSVAAVESTLSSLVTPVNASEHYNESGFFAYFGVLGIVYLAVRKERRAHIPALWFAVVLLYMSFGTVSITSYHQSPWFLPRFMLLFYPSFALLIGLAATSFLEVRRKRAQRYLAYAMCLFLGSGLLISSIFTIHYMGLGEHSIMSPVIQISSAIEQMVPQNSTIFEHTMLVPLPMQVYTLGEYKYVPIPLTNLNCSDFEHGSYLLLFKNSTLESSCGLRTLFIPSYDTALRSYVRVVGYSVLGNFYDLRLYYYQ